MKKTILALLLCVLISGCGRTAVSEQTDQAVLVPSEEQASRKTQNSEEASAQMESGSKLVTIQGETRYDYENKQEAVGAYDYVFAAKVEEIIDTEYPYREEYTLDSGETVTTGEIPYTRFSLTITECIKGQMASGPSFPDFPSCELLKMGGYNEDRDTYYLCPMDVCPRVGEEYLFFAKQNTADLVLEAAAP